VSNICYTTVTWGELNCPLSRVGLCARQWQSKSSSRTSTRRRMILLPHLTLSASSPYPDERATILECG